MTDGNGEWDLCANGTHETRVRKILDGGDIMRQFTMAGITLVVCACLLDLSLFGQITTATIS